MKVSSIKTFLVPSQYAEVEATMGQVRGAKPLLFVKVETDEGIGGWGEAYTDAERGRSTETRIAEIGRHLIGRSPFNIKHFTYMVYNDFATKRGSLDLYCALSALEQALWDIVGKKLGRPVYDLLGGACRDKIRVYANGWYRGANTPEEFAQKAKDTVKLGFTALKWDPIPGPRRLYLSRDDEQKAIDIVAAVREDVGPKIDLLIEVHRRLSTMCAIRLGQALEKYNPFWYEEPVSSKNIDAVAEVRKNVRIPVVTGEELYSKAEFVPLFEKRAADIINPDICACGGILETKEIAAMAEPHYVFVAPHNANSTATALAATVQTVACITNFLITEYFVNVKPISDEISVNPIKVENGYIPLSASPGLGLELNEDALTRFKEQYQERPPRKLKQYYEEAP